MSNFDENDDLVKDKDGISTNLIESPQTESTDFTIDSTVSTSSAEHVLPSETLPNISDTPSLDTPTKSINSSQPSPFSWSEAAKITKNSTDTLGPPSFIDQVMIDQVESNAKQCASNVTLLIQHLRNQLQNISSISVQYMKVHKMAMEGTLEEVQADIIASKNLVQRCVELNLELRKMGVVQQEIKDIKAFVSILEKHVDRITK